MSYSERSADYLAMFSSARPLYVLLYRDALARAIDSASELHAEETQAALARRLRVSPRTIADDLWRLERGGWLLREESSFFLGTQEHLLADAAAKKATKDEGLVTRALALNQQRRGLPPAPPATRRKPREPKPAPPPLTPYRREVPPGGLGRERRWTPKPEDFNLPPPLK